MALVGEGTKGRAARALSAPYIQLSNDGQGPASSAEARTGPWGTAESPVGMEWRTCHFCAHISHLVSLWSNKDT